MEYTNLSSQVVFLKDGDIVSNYDTSCTISGNAILSNGIPSFDLFKQKNEDAILSASKLCAEIKLSVDQILTGDNMYSGLNEYSNAISATRLSVDDEVAKNIVVENAELSNATITNLDVDTEHILTVVIDNFELSAGTISSLTATDATIDLTIANAISANTISATSLTATQSEFTTEKTTDLTATNIENARLSVSDFAQVSKLSATGISVAYDDIGDNKGYSHVKVDNDGVAIDLSSGNYERQVKISADNDINDILINDKSLSGYIHDEAELCATGCKEYTNACITGITSNIEVSKDVVGKIITDIAQVSGKISLSVTDILESSVSNLTADLNNLSNNYVKRSGDDINYLSVKTDLSTRNLYVTNTDGDPIRKANLSVDINGISAELSGDTAKINITYDDKLSGMTGIVINNKTLSEHVADKIAEDFTSFDYSQDTHTLSIELAGKILSVDTTEFIKLRFVHYVNILTIDTIKYLIIWIKQFDDYSYIHGRIEGEDYVKILLDTLAKLYVFQNGLSSDGNLNVEVDTTIPRFTDLVVADKFDDAHRRGYVISSLAVDGNGKLQYGTYKLLSSDVDKLSDYVTNEISLSANELTNLLSAVSADLSNGISSKIWIKDPADQRSPFYDGIHSDLSVVKIGVDEYKEHVATDPNSILSSNTLYVISSDYVETFGQQIKNVGAPTADDDATTKKYVDAELNATSSYLSGQIAGNDADIAYLSGVIVNPISADLYDLKDEHYNKTFIGNDRTSHDDVETDNLIITDMDDNGKTTHHDKWYTTFLSGTIVLKKLS